jgi:hypothetical protein
LQYENINDIGTHEEKLNQKPASLFSNISVFLVSSTILIFSMELVFPHVLHKLPLSIYVGLDDGYRVLGQPTKKSVVPENYIAIVGDSHALGTGDWYMQAVRKHKFSRGLSLGSRFYTIIRLGILFPMEPWAPEVCGVWCLSR